MMATVGDEIGDGTPFKVMFFTELIQLRQPSHGTVVIHDFADDSGWDESGQPGKVDCGFGVSRPAQHAARTGDQREKVPR